MHGQSSGLGVQECLPDFGQKFLREIASQQMSHSLPPLHITLDLMVLLCFSSSFPSYEVLACLTTPLTEVLPDLCHLYGATGI